MVWRHPTPLWLLGCCLCAMLGCDSSQKEITPQTPSISDVECSVDTQCTAVERCDEGVCVPRPPCEGNNCPCLSDGDCGTNAICDIFSGLCIETGCNNNAECLDNERCVMRVCEPIPAVQDRDGDGVEDRLDNCLEIPNGDQADDDQDGIGNVCERDFDMDGVIDDLDNCPQTHNPDQLDTDMDGVGDICTPEPAMVGDVALSLGFAQSWLPEAEQRAEIQLTLGEAVIRREVTAAEPVTVADLMPGTWIVRLDRAGFAPDVTTATVEVDQTVEVAVEAALSDLADADMDLQGITMDRAIFEDLQNTNVSLRGADLTQVSIEGVLDDLALDFSEALLIEGALDGTVLGDAQLVLADMTGASMAGVGLAGANLTGAILIDVQASGADLSGAVLDGALLNGALLIRADLSGASLVGANLDGANLTGVTFTDDTVCPNGQTHAELPDCGL